MHRQAVRGGAPATFFRLLGTASGEDADRPGCCSVTDLSRNDAGFRVILRETPRCHRYFRTIGAVTP